MRVGWKIARPFLPVLMLVGAEVTWSCGDCAAACSRRRLEALWEQAHRPPCYSVAIY